MKNIFLLLILFVSIVSCKNEKQTADSNETSNVELTPQNTGEAPATVNIPAGSDGQVHHYVCPDQCAGGFSDNLGNCSVCGKALAHNQAFHAQEQGQTPTIQMDQGNQPDIQPLPISTSQPQEVDIPAGPDGIKHHYVCTKGCKGGNGQNAGNCPVCGGQMAHNKAFHN